MNILLEESKRMPSDWERKPSKNTNCLTGWLWFTLAWFSLQVVVLGLTTHWEF